MINAEQETLRNNMPAPGLAEDRITAGLGRVTRPARPEVVCSKCHWRCLLPSRRRTSLDFLLALFFQRPYRCRSCRRRYYRLSFSQWQPFRLSWSKKLRLVLNANTHSKGTDSVA